MSGKNIVRGPDLIEPVPKCSLGKFMFDSLKSHGTKEALVDAVTGEVLTSLDVLRKSLSIAETLSKEGLCNEGGMISVLSSNKLEMALIPLAAVFLGATCAPLNPTYSKRELIHAMNISKPTVVFCLPSLLSTVVEIKPEIPFLKKIIVLGPSTLGYSSLSEYLKIKNPSLKPANVDQKNAIACIMCSSGTTGLPKGVMLTHLNFLTVINNMSDERCGGFSPSEVSLHVLPLFHAYSLMCLFISLSIGVKVVLMEKFDGMLFLFLIESHKVTLLQLVPPILIFLAKNPIVSDYDLSSVNKVMTGAAPCSAELERQVCKRLGLKCLCQGYGLTETSLAVSICTPDSHRQGSVGKLVPGVEAKVVDLENDEALGPNQVGELCYRGNLIMKGYYNNKKATSETIDSDGFLHTGDIGYYDEDGFFFVVDRIKELIKYKGFQVPPAELEAVLLSHQDIADSAVIGIPDEAAGEVPLAFVVKKAGTNLTEQEVINFVSGQVSPQKYLRGGVKFLDVIPKSPSGKILRRVLKDMVMHSKSKL